MKKFACMAIALCLCHLLFAQDIYTAIGEGNLTQVKEIVKKDPALLNAQNPPGQTPLWKAAETGQLEIATWLLQEGADPAVGDNENTLPVHMAAMGGNIALFDLLLQRGFEINVKDDNGVTPLFYAIEGKHPEMVKHVIGKGGNVKIKTNRQWPVMLYGAIYGPVETVQILLDNKADVNAKNENGWTPLHSACSYGRTEIAKLLIDRGADIHIETNDGMTPLMACQNPNCLEVAGFLISRGADVNHKANGGETALFNVASRGTVSMAELLLAHGADINISNQRGETALSVCAWSRNPDAMSKFLILHGARVNPEGIAIPTPLHTAARNGQLEMVKNLVDNGARVNRLDADGFTPLHFAIQKKNLETVKYLVEHGAFLNIAEKALGNTELHQAAILGCKDISAYLVEKGADLSLKNKNGKSALDLAWQYGHKEMAYTLLAHGADDGQLAGYVTAPDLLKQPLQQGDATVWFLGHAGWAIKTQNNLLIFDYFINPRTSAPHDSCLSSGYILPEELKDLRVTVFSTHSHGDHYNKAFFTWKKTIPDIAYVMCFRPPDSREEYTFIPIHGEQTVRNMKVSTIKATDLDGGFLVEVDGLTILHPGDHANGEDGLMEAFTKEVDLIAGKNPAVDILFAPIRGCGLGQPDQVKIGVEYMIETIKPALFVPMHAGEFSVEYKKFSDELAEKGYSTKILPVAAKGDRFSYTKEKLATN